MAKKKKYVPRLILFGNEFKHDTLNLLGVMIEEFDLCNEDFGSIEEASILFEYVSHFKGSYSKAQIVYAYNKDGLDFHHLFMEGPCFELKNMKDVNKLKSIRPLLVSIRLLETMTNHLTCHSAEIRNRVKRLSNISNKQLLNTSFESLAAAQNLMTTNAKQAVVEYITVNFSV